VRCEIHLIPTNHHQFTAPTTDVVADDEYRADCLWQLLTQSGVCIVLEEPGANVVLFQNRNLRRSRDLWRALSSASRKARFTMPVREYTGNAPYSRVAEEGPSGYAKWYGASEQVCG
jgi:hypothetical protein